MKTTLYHRIPDISYYNGMHNVALCVILEITASEYRFEKLKKEYLLRLNKTSFIGIKPRIERDAVWICYTNNESGWKERTKTQIF